MDYHYPIDETWSKEEIIKVVHFFTLIEKAYESNVKREDILQAYKIFKEIVPSKSEEKQYFSAFEKASGYSSFHVVKQARQTTEGTIHIEKGTWK
ncbi:UPF0223 family protein [Oceanobacillus halotolerans]|uniref:UPF0223 family protein n=1 Tax=Oceanobacillus halotolerans TaxID=2663380 RepID=UPI0013DBAA8B|nr:UPF0223 family protein [Oceanobacillus halotolerans]